MDGECRGEQIKQPKWKRGTMKKENKMTMPSKQQQFLRDEKILGRLHLGCRHCWKKRNCTKRDWWVYGVWIYFSEF